MTAWYLSMCWPDQTLIAQRTKTEKALVVSSRCTVHISSVGPLGKCIQDMAKRVMPFVVFTKHLVKPFQATSSQAGMINNNIAFFSNAYVHTQVRGGDPYIRKEAKGRDDSSGVTGFVVDTAKQGAEALESVGDAAKETVDTAWDAAKNTARTVLETTTAEADTNIVDTAEYRSAEDLRGQLGDGCNKKVEL
ncbi:hypothetical protein RIF29_39071 [Crotalaria pallida]|uniref:Uncharacterized protein n=1 Tax=Crotalaria pallida TaxID=3830 RepID=A0AAN9E6S2_CROPI